MTDETDPRAPMDDPDTNGADRDAGERGDAEGRESEDGRENADGPGNADDPDHDATKQHHAGDHVRRRRDLHRRAKKIFLTLCDLPPTEQQARLDEACGDDAELRRHVSGLLEHYEATAAEPPARGDGAEGARIAAIAATVPPVATIAAATQAGERGVRRQLANSDMTTRSKSGSIAPCITPGGGRSIRE